MLRGATYESRLWCVIELFVFLQMGGEREFIRVKALGDAGPASGLAAFDAAKAQCFLDKDRQKLLGVIEAGFGDLVPFNALVRNILAAGEDQNT